MFGAQPPTQPFTGMVLHCPIGFADWTKTEVIRPTVEHLVELLDHRLMVEQYPVAPGFAADRLTDADHSLLGRNGTQIGASRLRRVATSERESSPGELHSEALAEPSVKLSPHSAPIRQTHQSYQDSSARKDPLVPLRAVEEIGSPGPCDP